MKRKKIFQVTVAFIFVALLISCATIINGKYINLPVNTNPPGATVQANNKACITPCTLRLRRGESVQLRIEKTGFQSASVSVNRSLDGWLWGNLLFGGLIGLVVDFATHAAYDLDPEEVDVFLLESHSESLDEITIVIVDIDELEPEVQQRVRERGPSHHALTLF